MVQTVLLTIETPQLLLDKVVDAPFMQVVQVSQVVGIPVVTQRPVPMVQTVLLTPWRFLGCSWTRSNAGRAGFNILVVTQIQIPMIRLCSKSWRFPSCSWTRSLMSLFGLVSRDPQVQAVMMTVVIPLLQLVENSALASTKTAKVSQLPFIDEVAAHCRDELTGGFFWAMCTGTRPGGGHVHRGMAPP